mgnify:CR=1 FL=1
MQSFLLDKVFEQYVVSYQSDKHFVFVLPSKRSVYYSRQILKQKYRQYKRIGLFPSLYTIDQFFETTTGLTILSKAYLLYHLYLTYQTIFKEKADPYAQFIKWADVLLSDFNDILTYHPDNTEVQKNIFIHLREIKDIEHWSLKIENKLSENQERYLELMAKFYEIFKHFNASLLSQHYAYTGLNYEMAVKQIKSNSNTFIQSTDKFIFIGLNAITPAEEIVLKYLQQNEKAEFYWDYDPFYVYENEHYEAGNFIRKNIKNFGIQKINEVASSCFNKEKDICIAAATNDVEQALFIKQTLEELLEKDPELHHTAVILNKPENLNLILSAIPQGVEYNVSMEYPLGFTSAYQFLMELLKIFIQQSKRTDKSKVIYHQNFTNLLLNPFFKAYLWDTQQIKTEAAHALIQEVHRRNITYIAIENNNIWNEQNYKNKEVKKCADRINSLFVQLFTHKDIKIILQEIRSFYEKYLETLMTKDEKDLYHINVTQSISAHLNQIEKMVKQDNQKVFREISDVYALIQYVLAHESVSFKGEPFKGLQIIGLLESRLLDFNNILIPFMNEGTFPPDHKTISFLPYDLRKYYKLPLYSDQDAVFAYSFYRNLQAPQKIYLSYTQSTDAKDKGLKNNKGELSRYIQQIRYELAQKPNVHLQDKVITISQNNIKKRSIEVQKSDDIIKKLKALIYSPSSITTYLECSLKFYFRYLLKLKEPDKTIEEITADREGNIFHMLLQKLYSEESIKDANGIILSDKLKDYLQSGFIENTIKEEIEKLNLDHKGKVLITEKVLEEEVQKFLKKELKFVENNRVKILHIEQSHKEEETDDEICKEYISLQIDEKTTISLYGIPDRIDYVLNQNMICIVDYKSSFDTDKDQMNFNQMQMAISPFAIDLSTRLENLNIYKQLQLLIYIYYAVKKELIPYKDIPITACILPLRVKTKKENKKNENDTEPTHSFYVLSNEDVKKEFCIENLNEIESILQTIFEHLILNKEQTFRQTSDEYKCRFCFFNDICKKSTESFY